MYEITCADQYLEDAPYIAGDLFDTATGEALPPFPYIPSLTRAWAKVAYPRRGLQDMMFVLGPPWLVLSPTAYAVLTRFRGCPQLRWIPTELRDAKGRPLGVYHMAYPAAEYDVWDYARSDFYWQPGLVPHTREAAGFIKHGILDQAKLPRDLDWFKAESETWLCRPQVRQAIEDARLSGFGFREVSM